MRQLAEMISRALSGERGVALPMAMIAMLILAALMLAFLSMSSSEPQIAANHLRVAQARALAEAGIERSIWALTNPTNSAGLADPLPSPVPAPYDGSAFVSLGAGGYTASVTNTSPVVSNERRITATGWIPNNTSPKAKQVITVTLTALNNFNQDLPCALCVKGNLDADGNAVVDARPSSACRGSVSKVGSFTSGTTTGFGQGQRKVYGDDGNNAPNQSTDYTRNAPASTIDALALSNEELNILKSLAKANNAYYQGSVSFGSSNPLPNGVVFVDTTTGNNITSSTPTSQYANVTITGANASGWLIVNGSLTIDGDVTYRGLVYLQDNLSYRGVGTGAISGAMVALNTAHRWSELSGNAAIIYNCASVRDGNGTVPTGWFVKPGSWQEIPG